MSTESTKSPASALALALCSADRSWPQDADHENGNYQNKCRGCGAYFIGHKRRCFCRKCSGASKARWESLTSEQRADEQRKADAELTAWLSSPNK